MLEYANLAARSQTRVGSAQYQFGGVTFAPSAFVTIGLPCDVTVATGRGLLPLREIVPGDTVRQHDGSIAVVAAMIDQPAQVGVSGVRIPAGALGPNTPNRDLVLPGNQGVQIESQDLFVLCGDTRAFVVAEDLLMLPGISEALLPAEPFRHLILDRPGILHAAGLDLVPFLPTPDALDALDPVLRKSLLCQMPRLGYKGAAERLDPGVPWLEPEEVARLATRDASFASPDRSIPAFGTPAKVAGAQGR